jgi:hypothetical protein
LGSAATRFAGSPEHASTEGFALETGRTRRGNHLDRRSAGRRGRRGDPCRRRRTLERLLVEHPGLATARLGNDPTDNDAGMTRSLLHVATDWPGHFPNGAATVAVLVDARADVNARFTGPHNETPLHWGASSDDVEVLDALLDAGADIDAPGAVIAGGMPVADATAFGYVLGRLPRRPTRDRGIPP